MTRAVTFALALTLAFAARADAQTDKEVAARLTSALHVCESSQYSEGALEQALCYKDEAARQDQRLNDVWAAAMKSVSPAHREALRRSERRWMKQRDETCNEEAEGYIDSTTGFMFNLCVTNASIRRTIWLEKVR
jgi:uncharacterized protein YecT (DUF1311 family)